MADLSEQRHYHPELAIVDQDTFNRCRDLLSGRRLGRVPAKAQPYPFSGLLRCRCGGGMVGRLMTTKGVNTSWSQKTYDCSKRIERGKSRCTGAKTISERVVARTLIPFVARQLESVGDSLRPALDEVAREMSTGGLRDRIIAEAHAELADAEKQIDNLARGVATGVLQPEQARHVSQELSEKKQRLQDKISGLQQKVEIEAEFRRAIERLSTDIEADLWAMFQHAPGQLGQLMRFMFEPASIVVVAHGDVKHREAEILEYQFTVDFQGLITSVSDQSVYRSGRQFDGRDVEGV